MADAEKNMEETRRAVKKWESEISRLDRLEKDWKGWIQVLTGTLKSMNQTKNLKKWEELRRIALEAQRRVLEITPEHPSREAWEIPLTPPK
jgi:hypothetical protein